MTITIPGSATEGAGLLAGGGTVSIPTPATANLTITLQSDDTSEVTLPSATATILAGQTSVAFDLLIADDAILDGTQVARITASAPGCYDKTASIAANDNETAVLSLVLPESAREGDGLLADRATLTVSRAPDVDVVVALASSDTTEVTAPATVTIPAGRTFVTFGLGIQEDAVIDGTQAATITATVTNWTVGSGSMAVLDNDGYLALQTPAKVWEGQGLLPNAGTVSIGGTLAVDLVVMLESNDPGELVVPASVTIPAGQTSVQFDLIVQDDAEFDGSRPVVIAATAAGVGVESENIAVGDNDVHHFGFSPISDPQTASVPFALSVTAKDIQDQTIEVFDGWFDLTAAGDGGAVPLEITPAGQKSAGGAAPDLTVYDPADLDAATDAKATLGTYHGYAALTSELAAFAAARPDIARLVSIGRSVQGRELWAMKITDNPDLEENEPEAKYVAAMHGDEPVGTEMSLYLIDELLGGYGVDPRITDPDRPDRDLDSPADESRRSRGRHPRRTPRATT